MISWMALNIKICYTDVLNLTGCLITADGSNDDKITPEGLVGYVVRPPLPTQSSEEPMIPKTPAPEGIPNGGLINVDEDEELHEINDEDLEVDHEDGSRLPPWPCRSENQRHLR